MSNRKTKEETIVYERAKKIAQRTQEELKESGYLSKLKKNTAIVVRYLPDLKMATGQLAEQLKHLQTEKLSAENLLFIYNTSLGAKNLVLENIRSCLNRIATESNSYSANPIINSQAAAELQNYKAITAENVSKLSEILVSGMQTQMQKTPPNVDQARYLTKVAEKLVRITKDLRCFGVDFSAAMLNAEVEKIQKFIKADGKMPQDIKKDTEQTIPLSFLAKPLLSASAYGSIPMESESLIKTSRPMKGL